MSVTFFIEALPLGTFTVECFATGTMVALTTDSPSYEAANEFIAVHQLTCEECSIYRPFAVANMDVDVSLNMSNANARVVCDALDLMDEDMSGHEDGPAFLARVLVALGTARMDAGVPALIDTTTGGATWVDCGRAPGYVTGRLGELHQLAQTAATLGRSINWG